MTGQAHDDDLLGRMAAGEEEAFAALYRRRQAGIYRFALHMSGSVELAEDVAQEVFLHLARDAGAYDPARGTLVAYLFGMARKLVLKHLDRRWTAVPRVEGDESAASGDALTDLTRREAIQSVRQAVLSLPEHYREVVVLCDLQEMDYTEAAAALDADAGPAGAPPHVEAAVREALPPTPAPLPAPR